MKVKRRLEREKGAITGSMTALKTCGAKRSEAYSMERRNGCP